nr:AAA family ATPase [Leptospira abararensis]
MFTQFEKLSDSLYKGNYLINNKLAGIYFLNFSERITEEDFNEIQYKYLAEEFYKNEEFLQWNIYLLFINCDISKSLRSTILTDDKYARKLIFQENEFLNYFHLEESNQTSLPDIVSEWKRELESVDLQEIYSVASYTEIKDRFLSNSSIKEVDEVVSNELTNVLSIEKVTNVNLKSNYRDFPLIRNFDFGLVNLILGTNGTGKTSLLESIELILTGKSNRNSTKDEENGSISAILNDETEEIYTPQDTAKYKSRDVKWYNRNYHAKGNNCYQSFNQFNFFNTDAAYQFASTEHEDQINKSLKQIIFGSNYSFLRDRISGLEKVMKPELSGLERKLQEKRESINANSKLIDDLKSDKTLDEIKKKIAGNILEIKFKIKYSEDNYSIPNLSINELRTEIEYILNQNLVFNFNNFNFLRSQIYDQLKTANALKEKYNEGVSRQADLHAENNSLELKSSKITSFLKYFAIEEIDNIENAEEQLQQYNSKILKLEKLKIELSKLNLDSFLSNSQSITDIEVARKEELRKVSIERKAVENDIIVLSENFSAIEDLINKIKLLGKEYLSHNEHSKTCPLCEQQIPHIELFNKIDVDFKRNLDKSILNEKSNRLSELKISEATLTSELGMLNKLKSISKEQLTDIDTLTARELINRLSSLLTETEVLLIQKTKTEAIIAQIQNIEGSIAEFILLKENIRTYLNQNNPFNKVELDKLLGSLEKDIKERTEAIDKISQENYKLISDLNKSLQLNEVTNNIPKILDGINSKIDKLNSIENSFTKIKRHIDLPDDKSISDLSKELNVLEKNILSLEDSENRKLELQRRIEELQHAESFISENNLKYERLKKAVVMLQKLLSSDGEGNLEEYFNNNLKEILNVFKTIHSPQEFTDIKFENKNLVLYKGEAKYSVSQVSTGQRAALVISIFISLNRKIKNGPKIIIFDDPVTFIDDFNALSFLDFLRYFIVKENKQIFFATANKKFSFLFKKKFEFLMGEYKEFELIR